MATSTPFSNTGSPLYNSKGDNYTGVALSTQVIIMVNQVAIGAIQNLSVRENREITMVSEVGSDGVIDSAPTRSSEITGTCNRVRFDRKRVTEAFGRDFLHTHSQRIPFDIDIHDRWLGDKSSTITTTIRNVWITSISYDYKVDNWLIFDALEWKAETIYSKLNGNSVGLVSRPGVQYNQAELLSDSGVSRGTMDYPGLLTADFFGNL